MTNLDSVINNSMHKTLTRSHYPPSEQNPGVVGDPSGEVKDLPSVVREIREISYFLWAVNVRVLEILGIDRSESSYLAEQTKLINWFVRFVLMRQPPGLKHSPNNSDQGDPLGASKIREALYQKVKDAVHSNDHEVIYKVTLPWSGCSDKPIYVSRRQILINRSVINLLGFYYKNTNKDKWVYKFGEDKYFLLQITNFGHRWIRRKENVAKRNIAKKMSVAMIPWEEPFPTGIPSRRIQNKIKCPNFSYELSVVSTKAKKDKVPQFQDSQVFELNQKHTQEPKLWAWIAWMKLNAKIETPREYQPTPGLQKGLSSYLEESIRGASFDEEDQIAYFRSVINDNDKLSQKLANLFDFLWSINAQFMERLGCERTEEQFVKEQAAVQLYFGSILSQLRQRKGNLDSRAMNDAAQSLFNNPLLEKLDGLMIKGFLHSKDSKARYKLQNPERFILVKTTITTVDLIMAEIVCNILGSYYKNQNLQKWNLLFKLDQHMFDFLIRISSINSNRTMHSFYRGSLFPELKSHNLLPWKKKDEILPRSLPQKVRNRFRDYPGVSLYKLLEEVD
ncbi:hypothetical protein PSTG_14658 [Puccinia striiformis f. sp. tritici PST-78]|uniref:Uncharacterized protein n=1 Tax=Puccinia striiformis f. sp. tritici PST-78 TaxID=1165861 RepID=A0A0L0UY45_9BASI|nr:hypothetical protein PSTG_14658 [Puccinia striiformis f. sp. tritici PST-78]